MKIRSKIILSLVITAICIIISYAIFLIIKSKRDHLLKQSYQLEQESSVRTALRINERTLVNLVKDYACWDEMVKFSHSRDESWSKSNLSTILTTHSLSAIWIFDKNKKLIYSLTNTPPVIQFAALFNDSLFNFLNLKGQNYFYHSQLNYLFEFAASTIHPTGDTLQKSPVFGYFFICCVLDQPSLHNLEVLSGSSVRLVSAPEAPNQSLDDSRINTIIHLYAWNKSPVGTLEFRRDQPLLKSYLAITNITSLFYLCFALILLIVVSIALHHWLNFPLKRITESLALEDSDLIRPIAKQNNEFGQVAVMIERFFDQKKELANIIDEKNEILASLAEAESKNRAILSAIPDHLFRIDLFGIIRDYQIKNRSDFFLEPEEMVGKNFEEILPATLSFQLHHTISELNKTKESQFFTFSVPGPKEQIKYFEGTITMTNLGDYLVVIRNITMRKEAELALYRLLEKEGELNRIRTHFLTTISHEFRTPLSAILSNIQMLELYEEKWDANKKAPAFHRILQAIKHMNNLLNDLSVIARDETGKFQINPTRFDIVAFLEDLIKETANLPDPSPMINIESRLRERLVSLDKDLLRYIFSNLLSNALKFSGKDPTVSIIILDGTDSSVEIQIRDNGIGITASDLSVIYEPFHRGQNVAGYPGTGLGLSIVKRCIDLHKGSINIESTPDKGTVVSVALPQLLNNHLES